MVKCCYFITFSYLCLEFSQPTFGETSTAQKAQHWLEYWNWEVKPVHHCSFIRKIKTSAIFVLRFSSEWFAVFNKYRNLLCFCGAARQFGICSGVVCSSNFLERRLPRGHERKGEIFSFLLEVLVLVVTYVKLYLIFQYS